MDAQVTCESYCCNPGGGMKYCKVEEDECEDAGWGWCLEGISEPVTPALPADCMDKEAWHDVDGDGCEAYSANKWCTLDGKPGLGWHQEWGNLSEFAANGYTVFKACCACGGGTRGATNPNARRYTYAGCECTKKWEDHGLSCEHSCCNPDDDPAGEWCIVEDEWCEASRWGYCRPDGPAADNGEMESVGAGDKHGHCTDVTGWKDLDEEDCQAYASKSYCTEVGGVGLGWNLDWGSFAEFVFPGAQSASAACCACGGGKRDDEDWERGEGTEPFGDEDDKVRTTLSGCECKIAWAMEGVGECKNYCCNPDSDTIGAWCMVKDTACEDSDWGYCASSGLGFIEATPRGPMQDAAHCSDVASWEDEDGDGCAMYEGAQWCTTAGEPGPGWHEEWGMISDKAWTACCACGGGTLPGDEEDQGMVEAVANLISETPERMWWVASGPCTMEDNGCITSGNWPAKYGPKEQCQIGVEPGKAKPIHVKFWETERKYDVMKINGEYFSGSKAPNGIIPTSTIFWGSDSKDERKGWQICPRGEALERKPGVTVLKLAGGFIGVVFCCCCGAFAGLWIHTYKNMAHGDGLGAGPTKIGKYSQQEDA